MFAAVVAPKKSPAAADANSHSPTAGAIAEWLPWLLNRLLSNCRLRAQHTRSVSRLR